MKDDSRTAMVRMRSAPVLVPMPAERPYTYAVPDGMELISEIRQIYDNYDYPTEILTASVRTVNHVKQAALIGADVITAPPATLRALVSHPLTDNGLAAFLADWAKTGQKIG